MQRVTIVLDDELAAAVDDLVARQGYQNRSEAIRDLARSGLRQAAEDRDAGGDCVAALVYAYDHGERELSRRLARTFHDHHDLSVSSLHVHLDHDTCLEVDVLRGNAGAVRGLAGQVIAERGVRHGRVVMIPADVGVPHSHGGASKKHVHTRVRKAG